MLKHPHVKLLAPSIISITPMSKSTGLVNFLDIVYNDITDNDDEPTELEIVIEQIRAEIGTGPSIEPKGQLQIKFEDGTNYLEFDEFDSF